MTADPVLQDRRCEPRQRVAVDLLGLDETGRIQIRFMQALIRHARDVEFVLLTRPGNERTLAHLEAANVRQVTVREPRALQSLLTRVWARVPGRPGGPPGWSRHIRTATANWRPGVLARLRANVVFCPFTNSRISDPSVPMVAAVHDLQHLSHPHLLTSSERVVRAREFDAITRRADRIVCSTGSLRKVALQSQSLAPEQLYAVAPGRLLIPPVAAQATIDAALARYGLVYNRFILFAADFEARHNHRLVLTAWGILRARHPQSELKLVCAGGPDRRVAEVRAAAKRMGLETRVLFAGGPGIDELSALIQGCRALIVPALYDTLGDLVLEAMARGRPVLCSQVADLAELSSGAARMFDPHRPADLAALLERVEHDAGFLEPLPRLGRERVAMLDDPASIADAYLAIFRDAAARVST